MLFSLLEAATSTSDVPNSNVALFDLAFPGSQPVRIDRTPKDHEQSLTLIGIPSSYSPPRSPRCHRLEL